MYPNFVIRVRVQLGKADRHSLDFTFNSFCMKLLKLGILL